MRKDTLDLVGRELVGRELALFVDRHGDHAGEILWCSALAMIEQAARARLDRLGSRWQHLPRAELRVLRTDLARALGVAHLASSIEHTYHELWDQRERPARAAAAAERATVKRAAAMQGVWAKRAHRAARAEGRERASVDEVRASIADGLLEEARKAGRRA
jgi:hypothetical protein